ncbi:substrate-binding and VWA domain-containing protein [Actinomycetospora chlora]|uniref:Substrate-binding and VWA domain-containing protein n=1 Tax=Actinomycetospora chlora TaxID=663608 RepID=A0ABP9BA41_9PSEU
MADGRGRGGHENHPRWLVGFVLLVLFLLGVGGIILVALAPTPPETFWDWTLLVAGAVLSTAATAAWARGVLLRVVPRVTGTLRRVLAWVARRRVLVPAAIVVALGILLGAPGLDLAGQLRIAVGGCSEPQELRLVTASDNDVTARDLARRYEAYSAGRNHGCPVTEVGVFALDSGTVAAHATNPEGWWDPATGLVDLGPQPDLWFTSTSAEMAPVAHEGSALAEAPRTIATTPIVVGLPPSSAVGTDQIDAHRWVDVFRTLVFGGELVARPDPESAGAGALMTALLYGQRAPGALDPGQVEGALAGARAQGGFPTGSSSAQLCAYRRSSPSIGAATSGTPVARTAVIATEQDIARLDRGDPLGGACPDSLPGGMPRETRLEAAYPSDTRGLDFQIVRMSWTASSRPGVATASSTGEQDAAAKDFEDWLGSGEGRAALVAEGLRPAGAATLPRGGLIDPRYGVDPTSEFDLAGVPADVLAGTLEQYRSARPRGRVLIAMDTSGSMDAATSAGTRLDVVRSAVSSTVRLAGPRDEVGLWVFPGGNPAGHQELVPLDTATPERLDQLRRSLAMARAAGNTPLYRTMLDGLGAVGSGDPSLTSGAVVITDGEDTNSGLTPQAVAASLPAGARLTVVTLGETRCNGPGLSALTATSSRVECLDADPASLGAVLDSTVDAVWSGR